jgi:hypothetical protein
MNTERARPPDRPDARDVDPGLDDLKCDLFDVPLEDADGPLGRTDLTAHPSTRVVGTSHISYAAVELELELMRQRLAVWEIFLRKLGEGATTWPEVQRALTDEDLSEIVRICGGRSLREVLVQLR